MKVHSLDFMMGILQSLKVVNTKRPTTASPVEMRRIAALKRIHEQISAKHAHEHSELDVQLSSCAGLMSQQLTGKRNRTSGA